MVDLAIVMITIIILLMMILLMMTGRTFQSGFAIKSSVSVPGRVPVCCKLSQSETQLIMSTIILVIVIVIVINYDQLTLDKQW